MILLVFGILVVFVFDVNCVFKSVFGIACPGCGLTRGFRELFSGNLVGAFKYNILTIPIFLFLLGTMVLFLFDVFLKRDYLIKYFNFFGRYYIYVIVLVFLSFLINIIRGI